MKNVSVLVCLLLLMIAVPVQAEPLDIQEPVESQVHGKNLFVGYYESWSRG